MSYLQWQANGEVAGGIWRAALQEGNTMATNVVRHVEADLGYAGQVRIPYWELDSGSPGPCVLIAAAQHGNEVQGAEAMRRALPDVQAHLRRGRCLMVPFANLPALRNLHPHIDFVLSRTPCSLLAHNLNCNWPGKSDGNAAQRLAAALFGALVGQATHCFDLHCWNAFWAATALPRKSNPESVRLAQAIALPFIRLMDDPVPAQPPPANCNLGSYFSSTGRVGLAIEFAGQYAFWEEQLRIGARAVRNFLRALDMLDGALEGQEDPSVVLDDSRIVDVKAPHSGLFCATAGLAPADPVAAAAVLGTVLGDDDLASTVLTAPAAGRLYQFGACHAFTSEHSMMWYHPYVKAGETVARIVRTV